MKVNHKLTYLFLFFTFLTFAQENIDSQAKEKQIVQSDFKKIKAMDLPYLIPFKFKEKYGLYHSITKKEIIPPKYEGLGLYNQGRLGGFFTDREFQFDVVVLNDAIKIIFSNTEDILLNVEEVNEETYIEYEPKESEKIKGFQLDDSGRVDLYSSKFWYEKWDFPILINNKQYIVVANRKKGEDYRQGLININGEFLKGFEFNHYYIRILKCPDSDEQWFLFVDSDSFLGLLSASLKEKFYKKMGKLEYTSDITVPDGFSCYQVYETEEGDGIMDYAKLDWFIKPEKKTNLFKGVFYSSSKNFTPAGDFYRQFKDYINLYFLVKNGEDNQYFLDVKKNKNIPEKYLNN